AGNPGRHQREAVRAQCVGRRGHPDRPWRRCRGERGGARATLSRARPSRL
ncbi:MAG: hypothetical protein AVDCRST_MAG77-339, partial [uncultured Chloroflexi bacterium]